MDYIYVCATNGKAKATQDLNQIPRENFKGQTKKVCDIGVEVEGGIDIINKKINAG